MERWAHRYIYKTEAAPARPLVMGNAMHKAFELDGLAAWQNEERLGVAELNSIAQAALYDELHKADPRGLVPQADIDDMEARLAAIVEAYVERLQPAYKPIGQPEETFTLAIPDSPGWDFTGKIDARVLWGVRAILDFKSGKPWKPGAEHYKPQATAYLWADRDRNAAGHAEKVVFCLFPTQPSGHEYVSYPEFRKTERTPRQLDMYPRYLANVTGRIEDAKASGDFMASPSVLCSYCNYWHACPTGQAWTASHNAPKPEYTLPMAKGAR